MTSFRDFIRSAASSLPEIPKPEKKPSLNEKLVWTGLAVVLFFVMSAVPLYGYSGTSNQFSFLRIIFAANQGSLMSLGIGPIVTAGLVVQLLSGGGSGFLKINLSDPQDQQFYASLTKTLTFLLIFVEAFTYTFGGYLGISDPSQNFIVMIELFAATVVVFMLDEMIQKGWGIGSGVSLFIAAGVAQTIAWYTFSPVATPLTQGGPSQYFGIVPAIISALSTNTLGSLFIRADNFPDFITLASTIVMLLVVLFIEGVKIEIPITSTKYRGFAGTYPMKLLYVSNIPVILVATLAADVTLFTQIIAKSSSSWLSWLGTFNSSNQPIGGLVYYINPPNGVTAVIGDPVHAAVYLLFITGFSIMFAKMWVMVGGLNARSVAKNLIDADVQVPGWRRSSLTIEQMLNRYIPVLTFVSGMLIGLIAGVSDMIGVFGSGIGILLFVDIVLQYYQLLLKEQIEDAYPGLAGVLGA